ncbi:hypothetical protein ACWGIN_27915 [Streptomyces sp. NPDC054861]
MQTYTFVCDWNNPVMTLIEDEFVIVVDAETHAEAIQKAAHAALAHFPNAAEYETAATFWTGEQGASRIIELYGDKANDIVDKALYTFIRAGDGITSGCGLVSPMLHAASVDAATPPESGTDEDPRSS